jgi:hypothetical protein
MKLKGPIKLYANSIEVHKYYNNPEIIAATFTYKNTVNLLNDNLIIVQKNKNNDSFYIYHCFKYINNGNLISDRWYNIEMSLLTFQIIDSNKLTITIDNYNEENESAVFEIYFRDDIAKTLMLL